MGCSDDCEARRVDPIGSWSLRITFTVTAVRRFSHSRFIQRCFGTQDGSYKFGRGEERETCPCASSLSRMQCVHSDIGLTGRYRARRGSSFLVPVASENYSAARLCWYPSSAAKLRGTQAVQYWPLGADTKSCCVSRSVTVSLTLFPGSIVSVVGSGSGARA